MLDKLCLFCSKHLKQQDLVNGGAIYRVVCTTCGQLDTTVDMLMAHQSVAACKQPLVIAQWISEQNRKGNIPKFETADAIDAALAKCPKRVPEKLAKLLEGLVNKSPNFGAVLQLKPSDLIQLAYAANIDEAHELTKCLLKKELLSSYTNTSDGALLTVSAEGMEAFEQGRLLSPISVFISSTCHDLLDLRYELAAFLELKNCLVKLSEDPERFAVDPSVDSIQTCLANLEESEIVVCVIDRRYGPPLNGRYGDKSATHVEIDHARSLRKPVFYFMRERAWADYDLLRGNKDTNTTWVEQKNPEGRSRWLGFIRELAAIPEHEGRSNWVGRFKSSCDLKALVAKAIGDFLNRSR